MTRPSVAAALPVVRALHQRYESCVIDPAGRCTRWSHDHDIRCWRCDVPLDDADVVTLAGVDHCVACAERETGEVR
jgi:hypothetical protein